ncbi:MAG: diguanylate cyclase [Actinomycetota bacterium]
MESILGTPLVWAAGLFLIGFVAARLLATRDASVNLGKLADRAEAIATGSLPDRPVTGGAQAHRRLAESLEKVAIRLDAQNRELREYSEALSRAHTRFGEALRATHDLDRMLAIALETGMETVGAERGLLLLRRGGGLVKGVAYNLDLPNFNLEVGQGIAGLVAKTGQALVIPGPQPVERAEAEPEYPSQISVPLHSQGRVLAVLNLYDKIAGKPFTESDLMTIQSLCDQAGVAIENVLLHQEAQRMAIMDGLTGIWNHRWFQIQFAQELDRAERFGRPFSLVVLDIDNFKSFNDTYGHQVGDFVLVELASRIRSSVRDVDMFARYGGEEFELLLSETDLAGGMNAAEKVRESIGGTPFVSPMVPEPLKVTVSVGVASYPEAGPDQASVFKAADTAMYWAKSEGKNRVVAFRAEQTPR